MGFLRRSGPAAAGTIAVLAAAAVVAAPAQAGDSTAAVLAAKRAAVPATAGTVRPGEVSYPELGVATGPAAAGGAAAVSSAKALSAVSAAGFDHTSLAPGAPSAQLLTYRSGLFAGPAEPGLSAPRTDTLAWVLTYRRSAPFLSRPANAPNLPANYDCDFTYVVDAATGAGLDAFQTCRASATPTAPPTGPRAAAACGAYNPRGNFAGYEQNTNDSHYYEGVSAYITTEASVVCSGDSTQDNISLAWSMVASGDGKGWAQSGFAGWPGSGIHHFAQIYDGSTTPITKFSPGSVAVNQRHTYQSQYYRSCACMKSTVDSTVFAQSAWSPYTRWKFPYQLQFNGEVKYPQSNVPGSSGAHTQFKSLGGQRYLDDILEPMPCTMFAANDFPTRWHLQSAGCQNFDMWAT